MEFVIYFSAGLVLSAISASLILRTREKSWKEKEAGWEAQELSRQQQEAAHTEKETALRMESVRLQAEVDKLREIQAEKEKNSREALAAQQKNFDIALGNMKEHLRSATEQMLKERQKEFTETSGTAIGQLVTPLKENIAELRKTMEQGSRQQAELSGEMRERLKNLMQQSEAARKSADELAAAFKHGSKMQGDWGETILEELLSSQGLTKGIHFDVQATITGSDGRPLRNEETGGIMRPDVILHLDERREVIIDSKVSLTSYVDYVNADTEELRQAALKGHLDSIKKHIRELAAKDYSEYIRAPKMSAGYVLMFIPNTGALWTALNTEPDLWRRAADSKVYMTDEQSLYGALKIVSLTWTQVAQAQNHEKVYTLANEMIDRVGQFMERYEAMGRALEKVRDEWEKGKKKLDPAGQSVQNTAKKLIALGARNSDRHPLDLPLDIDDIPALPETSEPMLPEDNVG